ncbi:YbaB/EbfC family nucleoid-associated protein [Rhodococcus sp. D2-41]|uniref:YbaB/EbfC family nucleoid-associated protein n=1 Tax=Speluncibacter jeojiensis TaxID=2710754 RepID=A0A9X4M3T6_9ACTN|nr:YbaB/EbfC family nucleoid-associated protein [Rhodococcus sp. D2-41]MDG3010003.1 YbaB/EbfC family nucleoid-associated protein [Rhodococcus sp. D2-41]MDG3016292.1 YbaB/EbfC family nucleoid-associated protein [Corynebacteriales bacterium D3-21]
MSSEWHDLVEQVRGRALKIAETSATLSALRVTETSPGGEVTVEVGGNGALTGLRFTDAVTRMSGSELGALVVETAARAAASARSGRDEVFDRLQAEY